MKHCIFVLSMSLLLGWLSSNAHAQTNGIFSGQGVRFPEIPKPEVKKSRWPKLLDFSKDKTDTESAKPKAGLFAKKPGFDLFKKKPILIEDRESPKPFQAFTDMFPKRDPNRPSMLKQMNMKSKSFFERTTNWTERRKQKKREKSISTWDAITKDLRAYQSQANRETIPAQPPVRSAKSNDKPRVRF